MSEWIKCSEQMPAMHAQVIVWDGVGKSAHIGYHAMSSGPYTFDCDTYGISDKEATYWMPIHPPEAA